MNYHHFRFEKLRNYLTPHLQDLDEKLHEHNGPNLKSRNCLSRFFFWTANDVLTKGKRVSHNDLWKLPAKYRAHYIWKQFKPYWKEELNRKKCVGINSVSFNQLTSPHYRPNLSRAIRRTLFWDYVSYILLQTFFGAIAI